MRNLKKTRFSALFIALLMTSSLFAAPVITATSTTKIGAQAISKNSKTLTTSTKIVTVTATGATKEEAEAKAYDLASATAERAAIASALGKANLASINTSLLKMVVDFEDLNFERCVRKSINKKTGILTQFDLSQIEVFKCETPVSVKDLCKLHEGTQVYAGSAGKNDYREGIVTEGHFINGKIYGKTFHPGFYIEDVFIHAAMLKTQKGTRIIPGKIIKNKFIPGKVVGENFVPGTFNNEEFIPGTIDKNGNFAIGSKKTKESIIAKAGLMATGGVSLVASSSGDGYWERVGNCYETIVHKNEGNDGDLEPQQKSARFFLCVAKELGNGTKKTDDPTDTPDTPKDDNDSSGSDNSDNSNSSDDSSGKSDEACTEEESEEQLQSTEDDSDSSTEPTDEGNPADPYDDQDGYGAGATGGWGNTSDVNNSGSGLGQVINVWEEDNGYGASGSAVDQSNGGIGAGSVINVFDGDFNDKYGGVIVAVTKDQLLSPVINPMVK